MTDPIATTTAGKVRGVRTDGVTRFLGVPYAAAPVGDLRFKLPQTPTPWDGVRDAVEPGPNAPQWIRALPIDIEPLVGSGWIKGDDFLSVNVWTPDETAAGLPVMVFIHGGAFVLGSKDASVSNGSVFARSGVVCVALNYRMGVEGFLPIPGAPPNLGLHDQLAALRWVQANAAAFGGDPGNVTVFGESAGAMTIADLLASPLSKGLFRRAIIQSGHGDLVRPAAIAQRLVKAVAKVLGVSPDVEGFRSRSQADCVDALVKVSDPKFRIDLRDARGREPACGLSRFLPVMGDEVLPEHPVEAVAKGAGSDVELLIGTNSEEMNLYFVPTGVRRKLPALLAWLLLSRSVPKARAILKAYGLGRKGTRPGDALTEAMSDLVFRYPARRFAQAHRGRTFVYEFDWRSPAFGGELGACHGVELPFVFNTLPTCTGPQRIAGDAPPQDLADRVHRMWVDFARNGALPWPEYDAQTRQVFSVAQNRAVRDKEMAVGRFLS